MSGLDLTGAYLKGVSLCHFVEGDGYYQRNVTDCTEQRWMDAQLPNSTAPILNDEYVVESNLFGGHDPEAPAVTLYAGASWREVLWPDMAELGEDSVFYPVALCADRIFFCFQCDAGAPVQLYDVSLAEQRPALTSRAAFAGEAEMESF